jgi:hypothetical protein
MMNSAKQYHAYARECLNLAEEAEEPDVRKSLIDLSRAWMQAALTEKKPPQRNRPQVPSGPGKDNGAARPDFVVTAEKPLLQSRQKGLARKAFEARVDRDGCGKGSPL